MPLNLVEAGAAAGRSKSSILRAIKRGALSAARDDTTGGWCIEEAELRRAFPPEDRATDDGTSRNRPGGATIRELEARIAEMQVTARLREEVIADLRQQRDRDAEERRRLTALLTDQRSGSDHAHKMSADPARRRRSWWPWRRG